MSLTSLAVLISPTTTASGMRMLVLLAIRLEPTTINQHLFLDLVPVVSKSTPPQQAGGQSVGILLISRMLESCVGNWVNQLEVRNQILLITVN